MRISFDLDDTLICRQEYVLQEPDRVPFFLKLWLNEPMRLGTPKLMKTLIKWNCEIFIYTTSYRSPQYIRLWLCCYGIHIAGVINQNIHNTHLLRNRDCPQPSKNPRVFGIALHVDDSEGVKLEGEKYDFQVVVISPQDINWTEKVLHHVALRLNKYKL